MWILHTYRYQRATRVQRWSMISGSNPTSLVFAHTLNHKLTVICEAIDRMFISWFFDADPGRPRPPHICLAHPKKPSLFKTRLFCRTGSCRVGEVTAGYLYRSTSSSSRLSTLVTSTLLRSFWGEAVVWSLSPASLSAMFLLLFLLLLLIQLLLLLLLWAYLRLANNEERSSSATGWCGMWGVWYLNKITWKHFLPSFFIIFL